MMDDKELLALARKHEASLVALETGGYSLLPMNESVFLAGMGVNDPDCETPTAEFLRSMFLTMICHMPGGGGEKEVVRRLSERKLASVPDEVKEKIIMLSGAVPKNKKISDTAWIRGRLQKMGFVERGSGWPYSGDKIQLVLDRAGAS